MNTCTLHRRAHRGFTLTEVLVAMAISSLTLIALLSIYIVGLKLLKTGLTLTFQQQRMVNTMEQMVEVVRPATRIGIGTVTAFPLTAFPTLNKSAGNCMLVIGTTSRTNAQNTIIMATSLFCQINGRLYFTPNLPTTTVAAANTRYRVLAASIRDYTDTFTKIKDINLEVTNSVLAKLTFVDLANPNKVIIDTKNGRTNMPGIILSPRNVRGSI